MKTMRIGWIFLLIASWAFAIDEAELNPADFTNGLSQSVAAPMLADPSSIQADPNRASGGREKKAREASGDGLAGGIVATAIGGTLIAVGMRMLASPDSTTQLAGADLIGKGGQQLAQGISNIASAGENKDQENKLLQNTSATPPPTPALPATPELDKKLAEKGIDPQEFKEKLVNGDLQEPESVLKELGQNESSPRRKGRLPRRWLIRS